MLPVAYYIAKVILCSALLYGYYWLVLRNKNFHAYNRFFLLAATGLSLLLPLVRIDLWSSHDPEQGSVIRMLKAVSTGDEYMEAVVIRSSIPSWTPERLYPFVYLAISLIMLFVLVYGLLRIAFLLKKYPVREIGDIAFINSNAKGTPFSFFKYIFWNEKIDMDSVSGRQIFQHEMAHIREKHSFDKLFINIILILFWINPVFWLIRRELSMIHEFIADRKAIDNNDTAAFAAMILQATYPQHRFQLSSSFFYSPIKRRLLMLTRNNSKAGYIGRLMVLPMAAMLFAAFTLRNKQAMAQVLAPVQTDTYTEKEAPIRTVALSDTVPTRLPTEAEWDRAAQKKPAITAADGKTTLVLEEKRDENAKVLYVIDGKRIGSGRIVEPKINELVSPDKITEIRILKGDAALSKYGTDGKDGVIEINTKAIAITLAPVEKEQTLKFETVEDRPIQVKTVTGLALTTPVEERKRVEGKALQATKLDEVIVTGYPKNVTNLQVKQVTEAMTLAGKIEEVTVTGYPTKPRTTTNLQLKEAAEVRGKLASAQLDEVVVTGYSSRPQTGDGNLIFSKVEVEASFPGGKDGWKEFLMKNIKPTIPVDEGWKAGVYSVVVQFVVYSDGSIGDVSTINYKGTKTAQHCIDVVKNGPKWIPARQNGKVVSAYRKQPITFMIEDQK